MGEPNILTADLSRAMVFPMDLETETSKTARDLKNDVDQHVLNR